MTSLLCEETLAVPLLFSPSALKGPAGMLAADGRAVTPGESKRIAPVLKVGESCKGVLLRVLPFVW